MSTGKADERLTLPQAAAWLRVTTTTLHKWVTDGHLQGEMMAPVIGRSQMMLKRDDVERLAQERADRTRWSRGPGAE